MHILDQPLVFVDLETNGLSHIRGRIIEVAAIRVENGAVVDTINQLVDPETPLPSFITNLTGISDADVAGAPLFAGIAEALHRLLDGAIFVAHNVRFDYSFLKQEFKRVGLDFRPKQLCTMRLSRTLYPEESSHKLESIIRRHNLRALRRHRAHDDAVVLRDFLQIIRETFDADVLRKALEKQLKQPSLPKGVSADMLAALPDGSGVYIFEDEKSRPLYVGKSVHIKQRVQSHFMRDHEDIGEFKIAQQIGNIQVHKTAGELSALLLESKLVKELQPLFNKRLRKTQKLLLLKQTFDANGYSKLYLEESSRIEAAEVSTLLAVYPTRRKAKESMTVLAKDYALCPKLCGLEKSTGACFLHQLHKCMGACVEAEDPDVYNQRIVEAFARKRIQDWPFSSPVILLEGDNQDVGIIVDQWCVVGQVVQEPYCEPKWSIRHEPFDLDTYKILQSYVQTKGNTLQFRPVSVEQLASLFT